MWALRWKFELSGVLIDWYYKHPLPVINSVLLITFEPTSHVLFYEKKILNLSLLSFAFLLDDDCRLTDYRRLKTKILDLYDKRYTGSNGHGAHKDNMVARKQLVDVMFKHFDADNSGRVDANELSQVRNKSHFTISTQMEFWKTNLNICALSFVAVN